MSPPDESLVPVIVHVFVPSSFVENVKFPSSKSRACDVADESNRTIAGKIRLIVSFNIYERLLGGMRSSGMAIVGLMQAGRHRKVSDILRIMKLCIVKIWGQYDLK